MYAHTESTLYYPEAKEFNAAMDEAYEYAKTLDKGNGYTVTKVYGWCWNIEVYI